MFRTQHKLQLLSIYYIYMCMVLMDICTITSKYTLPGYLYKGWYKVIISDWHWIKDIFSKVMSVNKWMNITLIFFFTAQHRKSFVRLVNILSILHNACVTQCRAIYILIFETFERKVMRDFNLTSKSSGSYGSTN